MMVLVFNYGVTVWRYMDQVGNIYNFWHESNGAIYQGQSYTFKRGLYKIECWGAQGGTGCMDGTLLYDGGTGAYTSGFILLNQSTTLYIYVGTQGANGICQPYKTAKGGENGGGTSGWDSNDNDCSGGGGGASDVRLVGGAWNNITSLKSRIMVAAGGSGSGYNAYGAPGGAIYGFKVNKIDTPSYYTCTDTNQTSGYKFGIGCKGLDHGYSPSSGGGGGYYGGVSGTVGEYENGAPTVSSSGSSFVSGYDGCISIKESNDDTIEPSNSSIHYTGAYFSNSQITSGDKMILLPDGTSERGNTGNGYVRITFIQKITKEESSIRIEIIIKSILILSYLNDYLL